MTDADREIRRCIDEKKSFVLDAGAGSGKTYSLIKALRYLIDTKIGEELARNSQRIACITFTNVAKDEIIERTGHNPLIKNNATTIHDFFWNIIKPFQKALKRALLQHNQNLKDGSARKRDVSELEEALKNIDVNYSDRGPEFLEGRIFHDDLLNVAQNMFEENPLLSKIVASRFPYIFVDEYQDTSKSVISVLVDHVLRANEGNVVIGFFGDKLQNIYHGGEHPGVGEIPAHQHERLIRITKGENYRCSKAVINLLNRVRTDIKQYPAGENVEGSAVHLRLVGHTEGEDPLPLARKFVSEKLGWDLATGEQKELFLTHKLIAKKAGYDKLLDVYQKRGGFYRDQFLSGEDELIAFFFTRIEPLIATWRAGQTGRVLSILRNSGFKLDRNEGKGQARRALDQLLDIQASATIGDVLAHIDENGLLLLLDDLKKWIKIRNGVDIANPIKEDKKDDPESIFYSELLVTPYAQISAFCRFLELNTPFSTKHGVKGAEFDTVFVVLDDKGAKWNLYSFEKYLSGEDEAKGKAERAQRTRNLFYVCCSRSKRNLAVINLGGPAKDNDVRIKELFGAENCFLLK